MLKNAGFYFLGEMLNKSIPFLALPILTYYLSPHDFGIVVSYQSLMLITEVLVSASLSYMLGVYFFKCELDVYRRLFSASVIFSFVTSLVLMLLFYFFSEQILLYSDVSGIWIVGLPLISLFQVIFLFYSTHLQSSAKALSFVFLQVLITALTIVLSIVFLKYLSQDWEGRLIAIFIAYFLAFIMSVTLSVKSGLLAKPNVYSELVRPAKYAFSLLPHQISEFFKTYQDRLVLILFTSSVIVGEYAVSFQICYIVVVVFNSLDRAVQPYIYKTLSRSSSAHVGVRGLYGFYFIYIVLAAFFCVFLYFIFPYVFSVLVASSYNYSSNVVTLLIVAFFFRVITLPMLKVLMFIEASSVISKISVSTSCVGVVLAMMLVSEYKAPGVAFSSLISLSLFFFLTLYVLFSKVIRNAKFDAHREGRSILGDRSR